MADTGKGKYPLLSPWMKKVSQLRDAIIWPNKGDYPNQKYVYNDWFFNINYPVTASGTGGAISEFTISEAPISGSTSVPVVSSSQLLPFPWMCTTGNMQDMTGGMRN